MEGFAGHTASHSYIRDPSPQGSACTSALILWKSGDKYVKPLPLPFPRVGKRKLNQPQLFKRFSAKYVHFFAKFLSLNVKIRNNLKNIIFIACKWCKLSKYFVNNMVISCSTCQKKKKNAFGLSMWFTQSCCNLDFVVIYVFFPQKSNSQAFRIDKKILIPTLFLY